LTSKAIDAFTTAIAAGNRKDSASMLNLSVLGLADCLYNEGQNDAAIAILLPLIEGCNMPLDSDYPRYPIFADGNIADDALYIMGQCCEAKGDKPTAKAIYAMIARFIPNSRYYITEEIKKAIERLNK
jgi:tetratricopeptide (TPR) repeat protein